MGIDRGPYHHEFAWDVSGHCQAAQWGMTFNAMPSHIFGNLLDWVTGATQIEMNKAVEHAKNEYAFG
eukprot:3673124-Alexandrium_andersonii.AAC.1